MMSLKEAQEKYEIALEKYNKSHSTKDWEILIGPWLRISIYALYDRWYSANKIALLPDITVFSEKTISPDLNEDLLQSIDDFLFRIHNY